MFLITSDRQKRVAHIEMINCILFFHVVHGVSFVVVRDILCTYYMCAGACENPLPSSLWGRMRYHRPFTLNMNMQRAPRVWHYSDTWRAAYEHCVEGVIQ